MKIYWLNFSATLNSIRLSNKYQNTRQCQMLCWNSANDCESFSIGRIVSHYNLSCHRSRVHVITIKSVFMMNGIMGIEAGNLWHPFTYLISWKNNCYLKKLTIFLVVSVRRCANKLFMRRHFPPYCLCYG